MKKIAAITLLALLVLSVPQSAFATSAPTEKKTALEASFTIVPGDPICADDFRLKVGEKTINLLKDDFNSIMKASEKKMTDAQDDVYPFAVKTTVANFYALKKDQKYCVSLELNPKGETARGIKIGSTESNLIAAYPEPFEKWTSENAIYYYYKVKTAPEKLSSIVMKKIDSERPDYFYTIIFQVDLKTKKVTHINYTSWYFD